MIPELLITSKRLVESVEFDVNGTQGAGGHGGLTSDKTLRAAGDLRILIDRAEHAACERAASNPMGPPSPEVDVSSDGRLLVLLMQALRKIAALRDSEAAEPFDDALDIADTAIAANAARFSAAVAQAIEQADAPKSTGGDHG